MQQERAHAGHCFVIDLSLSDMLTWLLGGERSQAGHDVDESHEEVPETPAPTFVARAFKTALFGTPAPPDTPQTDFKNTEKSQERLSLRLNTENFPPKKPSRILLTPGTATTLRKTVSFDKDVIEIEKSSESDIITKTDNKTSGTYFDSLGQNLSHNNRKTQLTRRLENAREQSLELEAIDKDLGSRQENPNLNYPGKTAHKTLFESHVDYMSGENDFEDLRNAKKQLNAENKYEDEEDEGDEGDEADATTDLNRPHSQSGKYWKSEFENYHKEARLEMRKLLSYKELAKSFAKIKDERSINLAERLKEEQRKVIAMEETISRLSANIRVTDSESAEIIAEPRILIKELARQTARAVQYKEQVEEFRKLMEKIEPYNSKIEIEEKESNNFPAIENKMNSETKILISQMKREITYLSEKLEDLLFLKEENEKLRKIASDKDKTIDTLKYEKEQLLRGTYQPEVKIDRSKVIFDERMRSVNLDKKLKATKENNTTKSRNQLIHSKNQIQTSLNLEEYPIDIQKSTELKDFEDDLISRHNENKIQLHRSSLNLEELHELNLKPVLQASKIPSQTNRQESHISNLGSLTSPPFHKTRPRISTSESQSRVINPQPFHEITAKASKYPKTQDQPKTGTSYTENKKIINISPKSSSSEKYKTTLYSEYPKLSETNSYTTKTPQDICCRSLIRKSSTELSPQKTSIFIKKSDEDFKRSISCSSRPESTEDNLKRSTLSTERIEAAKKRLAEKKKLKLQRNN